MMRDAIAGQLTLIPAAFTISMLVLISFFTKVSNCVESSGMGSALLRKPARLLHPPQSASCKPRRRRIVRTVRGLLRASVSLPA